MNDKRVFDLPKVKRAIAGIVRKDMKEIMARYDRACEILFTIIDEDKETAPEDKQEWKVTEGRLIWDTIYGAYYKDLENLVGKINEVHET